MKQSRIWALFAAVLVGTLATAQAEEDTDVRTATISGVDTACTGTTGDTRADPRWRDYSLRLEFVGAHGQYLGDEQVNVSGSGKMISLHCEGPWVLMKLPAGSYKLAMDVADAGHKEMNVKVPGKGQARIIVRFPEAGGQITKTAPGAPAAAGPAGVPK